MFYAMIDQKLVKLKASNVETAMKEVSKLYPSEINPQEPVPILNVISEMQMDVAQYRNKPKKKKYDPELHDLGGEA